MTSPDLAAQRISTPRVSLRILVTGSHGLVGTALVPSLTASGHQVSRLIRSATSPESSDVFWDPGQGTIEAGRLEGVEAVIHLAGESIAAGRWTTQRKERIRISRLQGTRLLCETLAAMAHPPKMLVSASAIGYYGDRGEELLREDSPPGTGFLAEVCRAWEAATEPAIRRGIRVILCRMGVILSPAGGALGKMLLPFRLGLGGRLGSGQQVMSWIALDDVVGAIHHAMVTERLHGPVNLVAPQPVTNQAFTTMLGRVLHRPTMAPVPAFALRLLLGELADCALLASARVQPTQLVEAGYAFRYPELEAALRHLLGRS